MAVTTIRVQYRGGKPAPGYRVSLTFTSPLGGVTDSQLTDSQGLAQIQHSSTGPANVIVQGTTRLHGVRCPGEYTVTLD